MALRSVPNFETPEAWQAWFEAELAAALPAGWKWERSARMRRPDRVTWWVQPEQPDDCLQEDFILEPAVDWDTITVFCGNSDGGAGGVHWYAEEARVIHRDSLAMAELREVLRWIFKHCAPNVRGLS